MYNILIFTAFVGYASAIDMAKTQSNAGCNCGYKFHLDFPDEEIDPRIRVQGNTRAARHLADKRQNCLRPRRWTGDGTQNNTRTALKNIQDLKDVVDDSKDASKCFKKLPTRRVTIGRDAPETEINEFPMIAGLSFYDPRNQITGDLYTAGTIISTRFVLTAAHVLQTMRVTETMVILGNHHRSLLNMLPDRQEILPRRFIKHEKYRSDSYDYDIGIIELDKEIRFSKRVGPACLPFKLQNVDLAGQYGTYLGWGQEFRSGPLSDVLRKVDVRMLTQDECVEKISTPLTDRMLCAWTPDADACGNDSGGPFLYMDPVTNKLFVVGIISHGRGCISFFAGVNTRVTKFLDWIQRVAPADYCDQPTIGGRTSDDENMIDSDAMTEPRTYPVMAAIFSATGDFPLLATGTILSNDTIWTSASAIQSIVTNRTPVMVMFGEENIRQGAMVFHPVDNSNLIAVSPAIKPHRYLIHPKYQEGNATYDIAIIKLKKSIKKCRNVNEPLPRVKQRPISNTIIEQEWGTLFPQFDTPLWQPYDECINVTTLTDTQLCDYQRDKPNCDYDRDGNIIYKSYNGNYDMGLITYGRCGYCVNKRAGGDGRLFEITDWIYHSKPRID